MAYKKHTFVGLSTPVYLPDDIEVEIAIVPASVRNVRSNTPFSGQTSYTQHETANFNRGANADMHKRWLHGGAGGSYVGFNFVVDDKKIIQLTPLNEVTWAAGTPDGNKFSYHTELCVNADIDHAKARRNAAALAGGVLAAKGWDKSKVVQHNVWYGKDCPYLLRREGRWPKFIAQVDGFITEAKKAATGKAPTPAPDTKPKPADATFKAGDTVKFTANLNVRRAWTTAETFEGKPNVIKTMPAGTVATIIAGPNHRDGYAWYDVSIDGFGTGHVAGDWLEKTTAPTPKPVPKDKTFTTRFELPLRVEAGFNGKILKELPAGTKGSVLSEKVDKDGIGWTKVRTDKGDTGWFPMSILHTLQLD